MTKEPNDLQGTKISMGYIPEIDELSLLERIKELGWGDEIDFATINAISGSVETSLHFDMWAEIIENDSAARKLRALCNQTLDSISERGFR